MGNNQPNNQAPENVSLSFLKSEFRKLYGGVFSGETSDPAGASSQIAKIRKVYIANSRPSH